MQNTGLTPTSPTFASDMPVEGMGLSKRSRVRQIVIATRLMKAIGNFKIGKNAIQQARQYKAGRATLNFILGYNRVYDTLADAEAAIAPFSNNGHEHPAAAELHLALNQRARPSDYAALYHLARHVPSINRVFDLGGNVGNLFYCYSQYLEFSSQLAWTVFDLPKTIDAGRALAGSRGENRLRFTTEIAELDGADILIASGSMHYFERPIADLLQPLQTKPRFILINRTPLTETEPVAVIQEADKYRVACFLHNRETIVRGLEGSGYRLVDAWRTPELEMVVAADPKYYVGSYSGLWFERSAG